MNSLRFSGCLFLGTYSFFAAMVMFLIAPVNFSGMLEESAYFFYYARKSLFKEAVLKHSLHQIFLWFMGLAVAVYLVHSLVEYVGHRYTLVLPTIQTVTPLHHLTHNKTLPNNHTKKGVLYD